MLTHVSIMIGVTGVLLATGPEAETYELFLACELIGYLFLALLCIRCQLSVDAFLIKRARLALKTQTVGRTNLLAEQMTILGSDELQFRERILQVCIYSIYFLTFGLVLTVIYGMYIGQFGFVEFGKAELAKG